MDVRWPGLPYEQWAETRDTLHLWTQVIGKAKLALTPFLNEWWNVALTLTCRGMTTGPMPSGPVERPGSAMIQAFGEDQENFAIGFWPGDSASPHAVLYAYLSPAPAGVETIQPDPQRARWVPGPASSSCRGMSCSPAPTRTRLRWSFSPLPTPARPPWPDGTTPRSSCPGSRIERHPDVHPSHRHPAW